MRRIGAVIGVTLALLLTVRSGAIASFSEPMAGKVLVVKPGKLAKVVARPAPPATTFLVPPNPLLTGGRLSIVDVEGTEANDVVWNLPASGWKALGTPPGARGYRYRGAGTKDDPCRVVLVRPNVVKAVCRGEGVTLATPAGATLAVALWFELDVAYCAAFGGAEVKNGTMLKRRDAPLPAACECAALDASTLLFRSGVPGGTCGALTTTSGTVDLDCGVIYFGGGQVGTPPFVVADMVDATMLNVDCCAGDTIILGPKAAGEFIGQKQCSEAGCWFGPPLVVPNASSTPQSVCVYPVYQEPARGVARCDTGEARLTLPIVGEAYLTGDILPRRCSGGTSPGLRCTTDANCPGGGTCVNDPDLQPCPICNPQTLVCNGGQDNGKPCTPGSEQTVGVPFPTSRDCTVSTLVRVGGIPLPLSLTTGTSTKTVFNTPGQSRVFCGFCRDGNDTLGFAPGDGNGVPCTSDADCAEPYESCQQRNGGAFFQPATEISTFGVPAGPIDTDWLPHPATLGSVFCLPPTFVPIIDAPSDLPGPGAATFPGTLQLSSPGGAFVDGL